MNGDDFDKAQILMARQLCQSISKIASHVGFSQYDLVLTISGARKDNW